MSSTAMNLNNTASVKSPGSQITHVYTAYVQDNHALALSVNRQDVDRCIKAIRRYGLLTPPVVGNLTDGGQVLLSGECEFLALREIGVKSMEAVTVPINGKNEGDELSLLLSSLKKSQNALGEGLIIARMSKTGEYTQSKIGTLLGKSVSWVNKRISLATRLLPVVQDLVMRGLLCPQSAQEISRLPAEVQHDFSISTVKEGIPKSAVGVLVATYNAPGCPVEVKEQIVTEPRQAIAMLADTRSVKKLRRQSEGADPLAAAGHTNRWDALRRYMANITRDLHTTAAEDIDIQHLSELRGETVGLLITIDHKLSFSSGKNEKEGSGYGY